MNNVIEVIAALFNVGKLIVSNYIVVSINK